MQRSDALIWMQRLDIALLGALWLSVILVGVVVLARDQGGDFNHYWGGARTLLDGGDPYAALYRYPELIQYPNEQYHPLPWVGLFFVPLALLPFQIALRVWTVANMIALVLGLRAVFKLGHGVMARWQLALIGLAMVWLSARCIYSQQTSLLITTALLYGVLSIQHENWFKGGIWFSAILFKPWIAAGLMLALLLIMVVRRRWIFLAGFTLAAAVLITATSIIWPQWWVSYAQVDFSQTFGVKVDGQFVLYWPVATLLDYATYVWGWAVDAAVAVRLLLALGIAVLTLGIVTLYRWSRTRYDDLILLGVATLLTLMVVPYTRYYDYCILSLFLTGLFIGAKRSRVPHLALSIAAVITGLALIANINPEPWAYRLLFGLYIASWPIIGWRPASSYELQS